MTSTGMTTVCGLVCAVMVSTIAGGAVPVKLPPGFIQCKISGPNFNGCVKDALQKAIPNMVDGVPSLGIIRIDPLTITSLDIHQGTGPVNIKLNFKNLNISNIKTTIVEHVNVNPEKFTIDVEVKVAKPLLLEGNYEMSGKVLVLPVVGKGKCKISLEVSSIVGKIIMKPATVKNGNIYLDIVDIKWKFTPTNMKMKFDNLFNGDRALGDHMNVFLNENWREVLIELQPAIEDVFAVAFKEIGQQFLNRMPRNLIFPN